MKFLHTADIHLKKDCKDRLDILEWLVKKADQQEVDYMIIAGDLFDSDTDATLLRPVVKKIFDAAKTSFLVIPGNHDADSFGPDYDYGKKVIKITKMPFDIIELDEMLICGVPFQDKHFSTCIKNIPAKVDLMLAHGTLYDESFIYSMLEDEETSYMPIYPINLENIARYVALGHLHARRIETKYGNTIVVYPGSPLAFDTKCSTKRFCYLIDMTKDKIDIKELEIDIAPYWYKKEFFVFPGNEENVLAGISEHLEALKGQIVMPNILVKGYISESDKAFNENLEYLQKRYQDDFKELKITPNISSWSTIMQNQMVKNFISKTTSLDNDLRMKIFEIVFPIFDRTLK